MDNKELLKEAAKSFGLGVIVGVAWVSCALGASILMRK